MKNQPNETIIICQNCGRPISYNSYFGSYLCDCGYEESKIGSIDYALARAKHHDPFFEEKNISKYIKIKFNIGDKFYFTRRIYGKPIEEDEIIKIEIVSNSKIWYIGREMRFMDSDVGKTIFHFPDSVQLILEKGY